MLYEYYYTFVKKTSKFFSSPYIYLMCNKRSDLHIKNFIIILFLVIFFNRTKFLNYNNLHIFTPHTYKYTTYLPTYLTLSFSMKTYI